MHRTRHRALVGTNTSAQPAVVKREFHGRSWWPLNKYTRWLEQKANCWVTLNPESFDIFGHTMRLPRDNIEGSVMTGLVEGTRNRGRPRTCWIDNTVAWTDQSGANLLRIARDRGRWSALTHPRSQPSQSDDGEVTRNDSRWMHNFGVCRNVHISISASWFVGELSIRWDNWLR